MWAMHSLSLAISVMALNSCGCLAQTGIPAIKAALSANDRFFHRQINWRTLNETCPSQDPWVIHLPTVYPTSPLPQVAFQTGTFADSLYAICWPRKLLRNNKPLVHSLVYDSSDHVIGSWFWGMTTADCFLAAELKREEETVARVLKDSVPDFIATLHWGSLEGTIYRTNGRWYMISCRQGPLRHESFGALLRDHWADLATEGRFVTGTWED